MGRRSDPVWRDEAATQLLVRHLPALELGVPTLVVGDARQDLRDSLSSRGIQFEVWNRRCQGLAAGTPWPPAGPFSSALIRLPRSRDELAMTLCAVVSVLKATGTVVVYGANDEGIRSSVGSLEEVLTSAETVATGGRCRVLAGRGFREGASARGKGGLAVWKKSGPLGPPPLPSDWVSYPGVFAHGRLDQGTALLLGCLTGFPEGSTVLDYGCGSGVVGWHVLSKTPQARIHLLDNDALALEAARENVPKAELLLRDGLPLEPGPVYDAVVSNPPFHQGKAEDPDMLFQLVDGAVEVLRPKGVLVFVTQRRMPMKAHLESRFRTVDLLGEDATFGVWHARGPRKA